MTQLLEYDRVITGYHDDRRICTYISQIVVRDSECGHWGTKCRDMASKIIFDVRRSLLECVRCGGRNGKRGAKDSMTYRTADAVRHST